jgi:DNA-binding response OmpR family regulator
LVDDEPAVRAMGERLLTSLGYGVMLAESAEAAVELFRKNRDTVDLVLLDLAMPEKNGVECLRQLQQVKPDVRVLVCTGHGTPAEREQVLAMGALGVLAKPFELEQLGAAVAKILRGRP